MARRRPSQPEGLSASSPPAGEIRVARRSDAEAIAAIYNQGIEERVATFETQPQDPAAVSGAIEGWIACVVFSRGDEVLGFAKAGPYEDPSPYYDGIAEATIFVERDARRQGVGAALLAALAELARERGLHKLTAKVFASNAPSIALFERCGFRTVGTHRRHGRLEGEWLDVVLLERSLD